MFQKGLKDVVAVHTKIASVDGEKGELRYRGVKVDELINEGTFEDIASFLWSGERANTSLASLKEYRVLPNHVIAIIDALPSDFSLMDAMRTAISAFAHTEFREKTLEEQAVILTAALPVIIARHYRNQKDYR